MIAQRFSLLPRLIFKLPVEEAQHFAEWNVLYLLLPKRKDFT